MKTSTVVELLETSGVAHSDSWSLSNRGYLRDISVHTKQFPASACSQPIGRRGIDRIAIAVQLNPNTVAIGTFIPKLLAGSMYEGVVSIPGMPHIHGKWHWNAKVRNYMLRLEFNPSDFYRNEGIELCPFLWISDICKYVLETIVTFADPDVRYSFQLDKKTGEAFDYFPVGWESKVLVQTLDLAQDFLLSDSRFAMEDLKYLKPKWKRGLTNFLGGKRVETVTHPAGPDSSVLKIYDKYAERQANPKPGAPTLRVGHTRFEVHMPAAELKAQKLTTLDKLADVRLNDLLAEYWEISNWGTPMVSKRELIVAMQKAGLGDELISLVFVYLYFRELDQEPPFSDRKIRRIRKVAKGIGMRLSEGLEQAAFAYGRLDFESGGLITVCS